MNCIDVLKVGHRTVIRSVEGLPEADWQTGGVCGRWSVKEIIAHLASYEVLLAEALDALLHGTPTPTLNALTKDAAQFNDQAVAERLHLSCEDVLAEYDTAHQRVIELLQQLPDEMRTQNGIFGWYGDIYDLEDFLAYQYYGHKCEHCAQIAVFRDQLEREQPYTG